METVQYRIGIVDDDSSKVTQMITMLRLCCNDDDGQPIKEKYANYELLPIELELKPKIDDMLDSIIDNKLDGIVIDYKLSSQKVIAYSGVLLANRLGNRLYNFPIFVLTTYQDDLFDHELFDSYLVFDFNRYISEDSERIELNSKLIEQIKKYRIEIKAWEAELTELLPRAGESATIDERILELDTRLEKSLNGERPISLPVKQTFAAEKIDELISKIDTLIEGEQ